MIEIETRLRADADAWRQRARDDYPELDRLLPATQHRPRRRIARTLAVAAAVLAVAATAAAVALSRDDDAHPPAASHSSAAVPSPIYIEPGLTLQPLPVVPAGALSADEALAVYAAHHPHTLRRVPRGGQARYGVLRLPSGNTHRVWAYSTGPLGCPITGLVPPSPWPQCVDWEFVGAFTGRLVTVGQQHI